MNNEKTFYMVYSTDFNHSYSSRDLLGVSTTFKKAFSIVKQASKKEGVKLDEDDLYLLESIGQTQGHLGKCEYVIEPVKANILL